MEHRETGTEGVATFVGLEDIAVAETGPPVLPDDIGVGLPDLSNGQMLERESWSQRRTVRFVALLGLALSVVYLTWRVVFTVEMSAWFVAVPLIVLEVHHALGLGLFTFALWDVDPVAGWRAVDATGLRVALVIPVSDGSLEALVPVVGAAVAIEPAHETWILDDELRPEIERLALGLGARYVVGTVAETFKHTEVDVVGVIGPDQIVSKDFLRHTLGYLDDPEVGAVQTSDRACGFGDYESGIDGSPTDFDIARSRVIFPARNRWNAVLWEGKGAIVRVETVRSLGGLPAEETGAEARASIRMHKQGWRIVAHNEVLVRSAVPKDALRIVRERERAAKMTRRAMRGERILTSSGLKFSQRFAYVAGGWPRFDGARALLLIAAAVAVLASGRLPVSGALHYFAPLMLFVAYVQYAGLRLLARGHYPSWRTVAFGSQSMPAVIPAFGGLIRQTGSQLDSSVDNGLIRNTPPWTLIGLIALAGGALVWVALTLSGFTEVTYVNSLAVYGTAVFLGVILTLLVGAMQRVFYPLERRENRTSIRFSVDMAAQIGDEQARVVDLSLTGAALKMRGQMSADPWGERSLVALHEGQTVKLDLSNQGIDLEARVVRVAMDERGAIEVALDFGIGQWQAVHELAVVLFHGELFPGESGLVREHVQLVDAVASGPLVPIPEIDVPPASSPFDQYTFNE